MRWPFVLPLPHFIFHPFATLSIAVVHVYLAIGHLWELAVGHLTWTNVWKGFGALVGAYIFAALASRRMSPRRQISETEQATVAG
jgi:membrane associated rhomboid family serine protease